MMYPVWSSSFQVPTKQQYFGFQRSDICKSHNDTIAPPCTLILSSKPAELITYTFREKSRSDLGCMGIV